MADLIYALRVEETSSTTGVGTYTLSGNTTGNRTFEDGVGDGNECHYLAGMGADYEWGRGIYASAGTTLTRAKVHRSSNFDTEVSWTAGTKLIYVLDPHNEWSGQILKAEDYLLGPEDRSVLFDATTSPWTASLPSAADYQGKRYLIAKTDGSANAVSIAPDGSDTINGAVSLVLSAQYDFAIIEASGTNWLNISSTSGGGGTGGDLLLTWVAMFS